YVLHAPTPPQTQPILCRRRNPPHRPESVLYPPASRSRAPTRPATDGSGEPAAGDGQRLSSAFAAKTTMLSRQLRRALSKEPPQAVSRSPGRAAEPDTAAPGTRVLGWRRPRRPG